MSTEALKNKENDTDRIEDSITEKLFFLSHIPEDAVKAIVDFGCVDGFLFQHMRNRGCNWKQIGIEPDLAFKELFTLLNPGITLINSKYPALHQQADPKECVLNLSPINQDVYSYQDPKEGSLFWKAVFNSGFKYIAISNVIITEKPDVAADVSDLEILNSNEMNRKRKEAYEKVYGKITTNQSLDHFLLKYRYIKNWEKERHENCFPLLYDDLMKLIPDGYEVVFEKLYTNHLIRSQVENDFGIQMQKPTHIQLILKRIDKE